MHIHMSVYTVYFSPVFWRNSRWSSPYNMYFSNFLVSFPQNSFQAINHCHQPLSLRTLNHPFAMKSCFIVFNLCQFSQKEEIDTTLYFSNISTPPSCPVKPYPHSWKQFHSVDVQLGMNDHTYILLKVLWIMNNCRGGYSDLMSWFIVVNFQLI